MTPTTLPAQMRPIPRTRIITTPQTTKSHNPHHPNERTQQTTKYLDGSPLLSHGPITATGYPPPLENATDTHSHQMYIASSQTATTCWTPPTRSTIPSLSKNAYSHTHARASPGQTISPQSHPHNARSTRASHQCTPTTNHTSKATQDPQDPLEQPYQPNRQHPHAHHQPHKNNQRATSAQEITLQHVHPPKLPSASAQHHRNYPQPPRPKLHLGEAATPHSKTPQNHTPTPSTLYQPQHHPTLHTNLLQPLPYKTSIQEGTNDKTIQVTMQTHLLQHKNESRQDLHISPEDQQPEGIETSPDRHELNTISAPDYQRNTGTTTSGLTGHDSPTVDPSNTTNTPDISTCAQHAAHAHYIHQTPRHQTQKANHGATAAPPNKEFETRTTKPLDTAVARKKTHPQPTATYIATTSGSFGRTKTTKTTKDPTSTRLWPAPETTPPPTHIHIRQHQRNGRPSEQPRQPTVRGRGGRLSQAQHHLRSRDHRYNSPNHHNMTIGQSYRKWFQKTISRRHYSLGEATEYYTRWLEDPVHTTSPTDLTQKSGPAPL